VTSNAHTDEGDAGQDRAWLVDSRTSGREVSAGGDQAAAASNDTGSMASRQGRDKHSRGASGGRAEEVVHTRAPWGQYQMTGAAKPNAFTLQSKGPGLTDRLANRPGGLKTCQSPRPPGLACGACRGETTPGRPPGRAPGLETPWVRAQSRSAPMGLAPPGEDGWKTPPSLNQGHQQHRRSQAWGSSSGWLGGYGGG